MCLLFFFCIFVLIFDFVHSRFLSSVCMYFVLLFLSFCLSYVLPVVISFFRQCWGGVDPPTARMHASTFVG